MAVRRLPALGVGSAVLTALACLAFAAARDPQTISLRQLSGSELGQMSCADPSPASEELLWCADPSSPHCLPAAPEAPRVELGQQPDLSVLQVEQTERPEYGVLVPWPRPAAEAGRGQRYQPRLERPPRA